MNQKGFAPIVILVGILITTFIAGGTYYVVENKQPKPSIKPSTEFKTNIEAKPSVKPALENNNDLSATPSGKPEPTHLPLAIDILKNRPHSTPSTSVPTSTPKPTPSPTPTPTPTPTVTPSPSATSAANCNIDTGSKNTTITANSGGATFSLSPASGAYKKGESFAVQLSMDPKGHTVDAIDALLQFDPSKLTVSSIVGKVGSYNNLTFSSNTFNNSAGRIYLSLIDMSYAGIFNSSVTFAVVNFKVNSSAVSGSMEVKYDFDPSDPSKTTDANIVERNNITDVLGSVTNGSYSIKPDGCN